MFIPLYAFCADKEDLPASTGDGFGGAAFLAKNVGRHVMKALKEMIVLNGRLQEQLDARSEPRPLGGTAVKTCSAAVTPERGLRPQTRGAALAGRFGKAPPCLFRAVADDP
ncbi:MAG: hypothetical protein E5W83_08405 [Mesorhizobium sp.]|nr:MAG: hypothetical protein E5W83_08405 [Mesorhizobium sp.]